MRRLRTILFVSGIALAGMVVLTACSKDKKETAEPTDPVEKTGSASATLFFEDTEETVQFNGYSAGGFSSGPQGDTVAIVFQSEETPMQFYFLFAPAEKGTHTMGEDGFGIMGTYNIDTAQASFDKTYFLGWSNFEPEDGVEDAAVFNITS